ncbi:MAG: tRNA uridine-5-carboxymethylaminomethyl(34) synthesis GTPase MnmE [Erysipelotrichaceae bacterium]|nr:tRNA uridine-5-carboxymethylaminomethyl(34) synthesis GTPase MnmE [Erysipelotrichaceae bacterium]
MLNDTICAISTSLKQGAISIVRMSGEDSFEILKSISDIKKIEANTIKYTHIYDGEEMLDEVLVSFFVGPKSFTREDMVEINCHGGVYVTRAILNLLLSKGCRLAEAGEFTKRAYLNGRIDLAVAESTNDLINATTKIQAKSALKGLDGSIEKLLNPIMEEMKDVISMIEVNIDYPEYDDVEIMTNTNIKPHVYKWIKDMEEMIDKAERFRVVKDGVKTVIVGKPNVGKSSLLNALIKQDKAIVTDIAGTTRDLVEGKVNLKNITLNLIDTAGIRESEDIVEQIGIEKSKEALNEAELVIMVLDSQRIDEEDEKLLELTKDKKRIVVYNKSDLVKMDGLSISAKNGDIDELVEYIENEYKDDVSLVNEDVLNNERQIALMKQSLNELKMMIRHFDDTCVDVIMLNLEESFHYLCEILGREYQEDLIDHMFKNFCLGK